MIAATPDRLTHRTPIDKSSQERMRLKHTVIRIEATSPESSFGHAGSYGNA